MGHLRSRINHLSFFSSTWQQMIVSVTLKVVYLNLEKKRKRKKKEKKERKRRDEHARLDT